MVKRSENITHRLFDRQLSCKSSGSQLRRVRTLYENIVPSHTVYDVECPDHTFRKFTNDGQYLIAFTRSFQHLVVYRFHWINFCSKGDAAAADADDVDLPPRAAKFESFFTQLYCVALASGSETICKDFFLTTDNGVYGLFATSTGPEADPVSAPGAVPGVPSIEKIKILAVRLADGVITDDRLYNDDYIHLSHNMGVFMYEDLLAILSVRYQCIHILQIRDTGTFVDVRRVGDFCQEDDELLISSQAQREAWYQSTQAVLRKRVDPVADLSKTRLENDGKVFQEERDIRNYSEPSRIIPNSAEADFECYFRGLLGDVSSSGAATSSQGVTELPLPSANSHTDLLPYNLTLVRHSDHHHQQQQQQQQSSVNNFVLSSRTSTSSRDPERSDLGQAEDSAGTGTTTFGEVTAVSSTGSRHASGSGRDQAYAYRHGSSVEGMTASTTTSTPSGRTDVMPRPVPAAAAAAAAAARGGRVGGIEVRALREQIGSSSSSEAPVLCGIKQRLLSFIFRSILAHGDCHVQRAQRLKRFYYHFQHYTKLVMWKVQFLDRYHLLVKFGSADGVTSRSCDVTQQLAFFVVYNFETTEILEFQQNSSQDFLQLFENFADHFRAAQRYPVYMNYVTSVSNNSFVREQIREQKTACGNTKPSTKANSLAQIARRTLASLPVNSQSQSPSAYFDHSLFHFDEKLISATDRHKPSMEHPIKFLSRRRPHVLKFKINPGPERGGNETRGSETRIKRVAAFVFHPIFPFAISIQQSIQQSFLQDSVVNFHFRK